MPAKKKTKKTKKHSKKVSATKARAGRKRKAPGSKLTLKQKHFIAAFEELGKISGPGGAAEAVGVSHQAHYGTWWKSEPYRKAFEAALERFDRLDTDRVVAEVQRRAYDGWDEEVIEEEREAVLQQDGTMEMVPKRVKRRRVKKWSTSCLLWLANLRKGNPARLEVTASASASDLGTNGQLQITLEVARQIVEQGEGDKS